MIITSEQTQCETVIPSKPKPNLETGTATKHWWQPLYFYFPSWWMESCPLLFIGPLGWFHAAILNQSHLILKLLRWGITRVFYGSHSGHGEADQSVWWKMPSYQHSDTIGAESQTKSVLVGKMERIMERAVCSERREQPRNLDDWIFGIKSSSKTLRRTVNPASAWTKTIEIHVSLSPGCYGNRCSAPSMVWDPGGSKVNLRDTTSLWTSYGLGNHTPTMSPWLQIYVASSHHIPWPPCALCRVVIFVFGQPYIERAKWSVTFHFWGTGLVKLLWPWYN